MRHAGPAVATALICLLCGCTSSPVQAPSPSPSDAAATGLVVPTAPATFSVADGAALATALSAPDPTALGSVLAPGLREVVATATTPPLAPGTTVVVDAARATVRDGIADIPARIDAGPQQGSWLLRAVYDGTRWVIFAAVRASS